MSLSSKYRMAVRMEAPESKLDADKRLPFGWSAVPVVPGGEKSRIYWDSSDETASMTAKTSRLRLTVALDMREEKRIEVRSAVTNTQLGVLDIRYGSVFQPFELTLDRTARKLATEEGIALTLIAGETPFWFLWRDERGDVPADAQFLFPHLLSEEACPSAEEARRSFLCSLSSVQPFGWLEGCVLDGLMDLEQSQGNGAALRTVQRHLDLFLDQDGLLHYEDPRSRPVDGRVYGIEGTLPFATLAKLHPDHPVLRTAVEFWLQHEEPDGSILDGTTLSAEGSYTIAYPMAVIAEKWGRSDLADIAVNQLEARRQLLHDGGGALYLRYHAQDGTRTFRHWARAHAWYLLGLARTLQVLSKHEGEAVERQRAELARAASFAMSLQQQDGLWATFLDEPVTGSDTSGSAGIAAALAIGANAGILGEEALHAARRTFEALKLHFTPDGVLGGVAQSNKGGEQLQRSGYRVLSQMACGLAAQLEAALLGAADSGTRP